MLVSWRQGPDHLSSDCKHVWWQQPLLGRQLYSLGLSPTCREAARIACSSCPELQLCCGQGHNQVNGMTRSGEQGVACNPRHTACNAGAP